MSSAEAPLFSRSLAETVAAIARGALTARALAEAQLARVAATDADIHAWATLDAAHVRAEAARLDATPSGGALGGVGIGVKDIIHTRALPTEMGSAAYRGQRSDADAECVARLARAGGYVFGKTVTTELAYMQPGKTRSPWNATHTPGGSSSGSAAAVAAGHVAGALGTQTNGSVIRPAAYCGVVGFKPTHGMLPFGGVNVFSETLDTLGTFTRDVGDAALLAGALADRGAIAPSAIGAPPRLALLARFPWTPVADAMEDALARAARTLADAGARVRLLELPPDWRDTPALLRTIMVAEAARNLAPLRARAEAELSATLVAALDEGARVTPAQYRAALDRRARMIGALAAWLDNADAVLAPSAPGGAPAGLGTTGDPSCCTLWSLLGAPAITLPVGLDAVGLPLGLQIAARPGEDARLLEVAAFCEAQLPPFAGLL